MFPNPVLRGPQLVHVFAPSDLPTRQSTFLLPTKSPEVEKTWTVCGSQKTGLGNTDLAVVGVQYIWSNCKNLSSTFIENVNIICLLSITERWAMNMLFIAILTQLTSSLPSGTDHLRSPQNGFKRNVHANFKCYFLFQSSQIGLDWV